jgi:uncharacterized protein (TIGR02001 family)
VAFGPLFFDLSASFVIYLYKTNKLVYIVYTQKGTTMKKAILALMMAASVTAAQAQVSGNISLNSDYRFRGISQTMENAAFQGGLDFNHKSGFYIGNWNSNVSADQYTGTSGLESDIYAGFKKEINGATLEIGAIRYTYAGANTFNTTEGYIGAGAGPVSLKVSQSTTNYFGTADSKGTRYYDLNISVPLGKVTVSAHAGYTDVANQKANDYTDYNVGASTELAGLTFGAKYFVNDLKSDFEAANTVNGKKLYNNGFVVSVSKSF